MAKRQRWVDLHHARARDRTCDSSYRHQESGPRRNGKWSLRNEADYDSAMLNGMGDELIIRDAEEERAAREARLRICTIISYILYPIGWIIGLVGKLDLPRMDAPEL